MERAEEHRGIVGEEEHKGIRNVKDRRGPQDKRHKTKLWHGGCRWMCGNEAGSGVQRLS